MLNILIVDDEKKTRDGLIKHIPWTKLGNFTLYEAENGLQAIEKAKETHPDIVISDIRMPKMDGIEFAKQLRELYPQCKIIFFSGYSDKEYLKSAISLKAISYIEKPMDIDEISAVIKETVNQCILEKEKASLD